MNKLNLFLSLILWVGMVCGCNLSYELGGGGNKNSNSRSNKSKASPADKQSQRPTTVEPASDEETLDSSDSNDADDSDDARGVSNEDGVSSAETGGDLEALVGKWVWARSGGTTTTTSSVYVGSNGSRFTYEFSSDGTVEFTGIMNVMQGGCSQQIFRSIKGSASLDGDALTINWAPEKFTRDFSCDSANNYTKTMPAKTEKLQIKFKNDAGQRQLCIVGSECFSPAEK